MSRVHQPSSNDYTPALPLCPVYYIKPAMSARVHNVLIRLFSLYSPPSRQKLHLFEAPAGGLEVK
jgi:hypothetical protein